MGTRILQYRNNESYFHAFSSLYRLFYKTEIENILFLVPIHNIDTLAYRSLGELEIAWPGNTGSCSHFNFLFSQTSTRVSITVWKQGQCFLFLTQKIYLCMTLVINNYTEVFFILKFHIDILNFLDTFFHFPLRAMPKIINPSKLRCL